MFRSAFGISYYPEHCNFGAAPPATRIFGHNGLAALWAAAGALLANPSKGMPYTKARGGPAKVGDLIAPGRWLLGQ